MIIILQNMKFVPDSMSFTNIPTWELNSGFNPMNMKVREQPAWITLGGGIPWPTTHLPRAEDVINGDSNFDVNSLPLRDPSHFVSGQIHSFVSEWESVIDEHISNNNNIIQWIRNGVSIFEFFQTYKGNFKGKHYSSNLPPRQYFQNASICQQHSEFIARELTDKIQCGAIKFLGRVGECHPPRIVMPLP